MWKALRYCGFPLPAIFRATSLLLGLLALSTCVTAQTPPTDAASPITPEAAFSYPPEVLETLWAIETTVIPPRDLIDLTLRLNDPGQQIPQIVRTDPHEFEIGDKHEFQVLNQDAPGYRQITARLVYETSHAYYFVEEGVNLNESKLARLTDTFEEQTYPATRAFFGEEWSPGVDGDPHLTILLARDLEFNYQNSIDEFSKLVNPYSNEMEMVYINATDAQLDDDCILAHEFQHVTQWAVDPGEETWLFEGFSELACPVNGLSAWYSTLIVEAFAHQPDTQLNAWTDDSSQIPAQYGASYLFMTYFLDRFGAETTRALIASPETGAASIDEIVSTFDSSLDFDSVFADWVVANAINDPGVANGRYSYRTLAIPPFEPIADYRVSDLPVEQHTSVQQYATDYIVLRGEGRFHVVFAGSTLVGLAPTAPYSGKYAWWGGRGTNSDTALTREFDLSALQQATLTFQTWYAIDQDFDYAYVAVSTDGERWTTLPGQMTTNDNPYGLNYGNGYTGTSNGWIQETVDLTPYAGQKIQLRFEYVTDDGPVHAGIFIDDIEIPELGYRYNAEAGNAGWVAAGFMRNAMLLPQKWLLQLMTYQPDHVSVEQLQLNPDNAGNWLIDLGPDQTAILSVSGLTRATSEPAEYWYQLTHP